MRLRLLLYLWRVLPLPQPLRRYLLWRGNAHFVAGVSALIRDEQGRVLLFEHTYRDRHPWGMPGGWMGRGERPEDALARELREESGFEVVAEHITLVDLDVRFRHFDLIYACRLSGGAFRPSAEVRSYGYFSPEELPDVSPAQRRHIRRAVAVAVARS